jgi:hypothetical protein
MSRFPRREPEVAALASQMITGLTEQAEDFPTPPIGIEQLQASLANYKRTLEAAVVAQTSAAAAFEVKDDALDVLKDEMQLVLRYAEHAVSNDELKLGALGWGTRREPSEPQPPGPARSLEVKREGPGWVYLDWKRPNEGGSVAGYHVQVAHTKGGEWKDVTMCFDTMAVLTEQERSVDLLYRVVTFNKAGNGLASNTVTVLL